jgi:hypothetical protein
MPTRAALRVLGFTALAFASACTQRVDPTTGALFWSEAGLVQTHGVRPTQKGLPRYRRPAATAPATVPDPKELHLLPRAVPDPKTL